MKPGLSKRERYLLIMAAAALILFVGIQYGITRSYNAYQTALEMHENLRMEKVLMESKLAAENETYENNAEAIARFEEVADRIPQVMPNELIHRMLTELCVQCDVTPMMLGISGNENKKTSGSEDASEAAFVTVTANMSLSGDYAAINKLIKEVSEIEYITMNKISFANNLNEVRFGSSNISVMFEVLMLNVSQS